MIVDDSKFMRTYERKIVEKAGFIVVEEAANGNEAVEYYKNADPQPDVVLMDITMDDMDGITALQNIKLYHSHANVIMCSSMGQKLFIQDAIKAGANDFVIKPFTPDELIRKIYNSIRV